MATYTAPINDMMFLFEKLRDNPHYNELEKYKEVNPDLVKDILEQAAKITENLILPLAKVGDETPATFENGVVRTPPGYKEAYKKFFFYRIASVIKYAIISSNTKLTIEFKRKASRR